MRSSSYWGHALEEDTGTPVVEWLNGSLLLHNYTLSNKDSR